jgi:hypothetical protein
MVVPEKLKNKKLLFVIAALFGASLLGAGVFASSAITLNSGNAVSLGAGAATVNVCGSNATISTQQYFNSGTGSYYTGTISITGVDYTNCLNKTLSAAFTRGGTVYSTTWSVSNNMTNFIWGYAGGSSSAPNEYSSSNLTAFDTAASNLSTIAIAVQ